ncbi:MAG TPA: hypothetical protein VNE41_09115 [Chitinophagaceae bacterium]|nr:hypothetical protein [Chitinophagaceae bacterium]
MANKGYYLLIPVWIICFAPAITLGQSPADTTGIGSSDTAARGSVKIGLGYNSGLNYFGRTDSLRSSGFYPSLEWDLKDGLYFSSNFIFENNQQSSLQYAATILEGGYKFSSSGQHFSGNLFISKFLYAGNSALVQSAIQEQTGVNLSFLNQVVDINLGGDIKFSDQADWGLTAGLDHIIRFGSLFGKDVLVLDPSVYFYGGTQHFTNTYFKKINVLFIPITQQQENQQINKFGLLAWECSVPVVLAINKLDFILDPAYITPENVIQPSGRDSGPGAGLFYLNLQVTYRF